MALAIATSLLLTSSAWATTAYTRSGAGGTAGSISISVTSPETWTAFAQPTAGMKFDVAVGSAFDINLDVEGSDEIMVYGQNPPGGPVDMSLFTCRMMGATPQGMTISISTPQATSTASRCRVTVTASAASNQPQRIDLEVSRPAGSNGIAHEGYANIIVYLNASGSVAPQTPPGQASQVASAPKYSGPEFSSFGSATLAGNKLVTSGKKLDAITSLKVNGQAVTYKINSASELEIELPKDLAPGKYDVEINSVHGKLTHLQGITVKAVVPTKELSFKGEGAWLNYGSLLDLTNIAKQIGSEYTSVKCIVNAADPAVADRLAKRACDYIEANRLRGRAVTYESKSTYKGEGFWVRVVANG